MNEEKDDPHKKADDPDHDVRDAKERVPAPQQTCGRQYHAFGSLELRHLDILTGVYILQNNPPPPTRWGELFFDKWGKN